MPPSRPRRGMPSARRAVPFALSLLSLPGAALATATVDCTVTEVCEVAGDTTECHEEPRNHVSFTINAQSAEMRGDQGTKTGKVVSAPGAWPVAILLRQWGALPAMVAIHTDLILTGTQIGNQTRDGKGVVALLRGRCETPVER